MSRDTVVKKVVSSYERLKNEWTKKNKNLDICGKYLSEIKVELTQLQFLPAMGDKVSKEELLVARNTLEIGAQWSVAKKDIPSFERYMSMLKVYYKDYKDSIVESCYMYELLGQDLLCLLAQNKVGEFHTALELLPREVLQDNVYIRHPVAMEQYLMEGAYNKIYLAKGEVPAEGYKFFIEELLATIREDIADCLENAYERIRPDDIGRMLYLNDTDEIKAYCKQRGWTSDSSGYLVFSSSSKAQVEDLKMPSSTLAEQMISYAREMEQIV
uniref:26S proteasome non-ATPase regulatory subunit 8 n=1 Tax=Hirondellea gigas TaxID=1518452 RepID=A0A2P2I054_9CRUS